MSKGKQLLSLASLTGWHGTDDVRISWVSDGEGADTEVFTAGSAQFDIVSGVVVNSSFGQHGVVLDFRFPVKSK